MGRILIRTTALAFLMLSLISLPPSAQGNSLAQRRRTARRSAIGMGTAAGAGVGAIRNRRRAIIGGGPGTGARVKVRSNKLRRGAKLQGSRRRCC